jgi:hypothetical protein
MTAIVIWRNDEIEGNPTLWAAADSLVSGGGNAQLIADAVKIFPLPIICRRPDTRGFFSDPYVAHTLGYCFAGSTLMGQNAYLGLMPLLSNIISHNSYVPSMSDIARQILAYLKRSFDDYKAIGSHNALFEVAVFGYCLRSQQLEIFHFRPEMLEGIFEMTATSYQSLKTHDFLYLGDETSALNQEIARAFAHEGAQGRPVTRAPRYVIEGHISNTQSRTIGGDLQLAIADKFGFRPLAVCKPYEYGNPVSYFSYLGRELTDDLITVGEARISPDAMV